MVKEMIKNQRGFSLIEIMIALTIFSVYSVAMIYRQSNNVTGSIQMSEDLILHNLAELKMNEVLIGKRNFSNIEEKDPETGVFEIEGYELYKFKVLIKKTQFPDFSQIMGQEDEQEKSSSGNKNENAIQKLIFKKLKKNIEEIIWQVTVTTTAPHSDYSYSLNSWINKSNPKLDTNFTF